MKNVVSWTKKRTKISTMLISFDYWGLLKSLIVVTSSLSNIAALFAAQAPNWVISSIWFIYHRKALISYELSLLIQCTTLQHEPKRIFQQTFLFETWTEMRVNSKTWFMWEKWRLFRIYIYQRIVINSMVIYFVRKFILMVYITLIAKSKMKKTSLKAHVIFD